VRCGVKIVTISKIPCCDARPLAGNHSKLMQPSSESRIILRSSQNNSIKEANGRHLKNSLATSSCVPPL
jgi:hypothetical protein